MLDHSCNTRVHVKGLKSLNDYPEEILYIENYAYTEDCILPTIITNIKRLQAMTNTLRYF
jgi:hypothetical protein